MEQPFSQEGFDKDKAALLKDVERYGLLQDKKFMGYLNGYLDNLNQNGVWLNQGYTPDPSWVGSDVHNLINYFDDRHAFHVPARWWKKHKDDPHFRKAREAKAAKCKKHAWVWLKTEPYHPAHAAMMDAGLILETSLPGKLFDGKSFGYKKWSDAAAQAELWRNFSTHYADGAEGPVKGMILNGVVKNSVLTQLELPHLLEGMKTGRVDNLRLNVMTIVGDPADSRTWTLEFKEAYDVHSQGSFDKVPEAGGDEFWAKQQRWHDRQRAKHADGSWDNVSTGSSDASMLEYLNELFQDPGTVVLLSDPGSGPPVFTASPEEISEVVTNQLSRTSSNELSQVPSGSRAGVPVGRHELTVAMLNHKLSIVKAIQDQRRSQGSSSQEHLAATQSHSSSHDYGEEFRHARGAAKGKAPVYNDEDLYQGESSSYGGTAAYAGGMSYTVDDLAADMGDMAPLDSGTQFPPGTVVDHRYTALSAGQPQYGGFPAPLVSDAQDYSPAPAQHRTPSTSSAASDDGVPLTKVDRVPSDPPKKKPKPKKVPVLLQFLAGQKPKR